MRNEDIKSMIDDLNGRDKSILRVATNAIYFDDSSDYLTALWDIVKIIDSNEMIDNCDSKLFKLLNS